MNDGQLLSLPPLASLASLQKRLESRVRKALYEHQMIQEGDSIAVALSGGKDSLTLLQLLHQISGRGFPKIQLVAIHVSGAFSCGASLGGGQLDAFCERLQVPLHLCYAEQKEEGELHCYSCSRERRRLLFAKAKELGAVKVAFGHHREDHVQTLLMNLLHKGEFAGNLPKVPMLKYGITILRPLIYAEEQLISSYAKAAGFLRAVCRCPVGQTSQRRRTEELLAHLETLFPYARSNLARAAWLYGSEGALEP